MKRTKFYRVRTRHTEKRKRTIFSLPTLKIGDRVLFDYFGRKKVGVYAGRWSKTHIKINIKSVRITAMLDSCIIKRI